MFCHTFWMTNLRAPTTVSSMGQATLLAIVLCGCLIQLVPADDNHCRTGYFEVHPGHSLYGHVIRRMSAESIWSCVLECRRLMMCFSLNVHEDKDAIVHCELNKSTNKANPMDYRKTTGREYLDIIPNNMNRWSQSDSCSSAATEALPDAWYRYQYSSYKYFNEKLTNHMARERCFNLSVGADLVSLESEQEMEFVKSLVQVEATSNDLTLVNEIKIWIGLHDNSMDSERKFAWFDGKPMKYTNWATSEPNNREDNENCVHAFFDGTWNDVPCHYQLKFVCKAADFRKL